LFSFVTVQAKWEFFSIDYFCCNVAKLPDSAFKDPLGLICGGLLVEKYMIHTGFTAKILVSKSTHVFSLEPGMG